MEKVAESFRYFCAEKAERDPAWKSLQIIFSDASVPGEGEHKIMDFIRAQRSSANYNPNLRHVLYSNVTDPSV